MKSEWQHEFKKLKCCVIIPTYNNGKTLAGVVESVREYSSDIIVVNDGSTDNTKEILESFDDLKLVHVDPNRGKGNALRTGFLHAYSMGYEYAITIDSDGQHQAADLPSFLKVLARSDEDILLVGARNMDQDSVPHKSSFGNRFSNFWFRVETGIKLSDTQSGYRLYPIKRLYGMHFFTRKFEFEIEVLVRAAWKGIEIKSIPVSVYYPPSEERVSHFRPFKDFFRISVLNTVFFLMALLYFRPRNIIMSFSLSKFKKLLGSGESKEKLSTAIGFGVFMGIMPIWGYQMITAAFLAHLLKLNKALVLVASNISMPPLIPLVIYSSFVMGRWFVDTPVRLSFDMDLSLEIIKTGLIQYITGSILLAIVSGLIAGTISFSVLSLKSKINK